MLFENIKNYFKKKSRNQEAGLAPEGICPNCWGKQEWEGQFYEHMRAENIAPESDIYNNFIKDVTRKLGEITLKEGSYTCATCQISYKKLAKELFTNTKPLLYRAGVFIFLLVIF